MTSSQAGDPATVESALTRYDIAWTIFAPDARIVAILDRSPAGGGSMPTPMRSSRCGTNAAREPEASGGTEGAATKSKPGEENPSRAQQSSESFGKIQGKSMESHLISFSESSLFKRVAPTPRQESSMGPLPLVRTPQQRG